MEVSRGWRLTENEEIQKLKQTEIVNRASRSQNLGMVLVDVIGQIIAVKKVRDRKQGS